MCHPSLPSWHPQARTADTAALQAALHTLQHGSPDAEPDLAEHNYHQLFQLLQLTVEWLWQLRETNVRLYGALAAALEATQGYVFAHPMSIPHY